MLRSMYSAISGMNAFQTQLDVVGNNIANVDTTGFKASRVEFSDILSQTLANAAAPTAANVAGPGGINAQQVGLGVNVGAISTSFTQGADQQTGVPTDVALDGSGFFMVSQSAQSNIPATADQPPTTTPLGNSPVNYTRAGNFGVDASGNVVLPDGSKLLGYLSTTTPAPTQPSQLSAVNISVRQNLPGGGTAVVPGNFTIQPNGTITVSDPATNQVVETWVVPLANFANPGGLAKSGNNLYAATANSGGFTAAPVPGAYMGQAGQNGLANFRPGALEASNVNLTQEFTNMIVAQQGFDANSKVINTDNNILATIQTLQQQA